MSSSGESIRNSVATNTTDNARTCSTDATNIPLDSTQANDDDELRFTLYKRCSKIPSAQTSSPHSKQKRYRMEPSPGSEFQTMAERKRRRTGPRTSALKLPEWEENRSRIEELYMNNTLQATRDIMNEKYGFNQSEKLYKEKLNEWGMFKYMPTSTAHWIVEHEKQMRANGKQVMYEFGGQIVSMAEVRRKSRRAKIHVPQKRMLEDDVPSNIAIKTLMEDEAGGNVSQLNTVSTPEPNDLSSLTSQENEPLLFSPPERYQEFPPDQLQSRKQEISEEGFWGMYQQALDSFHQGKVEEALDKFEILLHGFNEFYSPNDLRTRGSAYNLAECYARLGKIADFRAVLEWLGKELVRCHNHDAQVNAHIIRVMELFGKYGSPKEAMVLLYETLIERPKKSPTHSPAANSEPSINLENSSSATNATRTLASMIASRSMEGKYLRYELF